MKHTRQRTVSAESYMKYGQYLKTWRRNFWGYTEFPRKSAINWSLSAMAQNIEILYAHINLEMLW
jgi:hypothetical protein